MEPVITDMSDAEYFADPAIDQTGLKRFRVSPKAYAAYLTGEVASFPALEFGTAAHSLVLGSGPTVLVKPNLRTKAGKTEFEELQAKHEGEDIVWVSQADFDTVHAMEEEVSSYFLGIPGRPEIALFADDPKTGLRLKGKIDWLPDSPDEDGVMWLRDYKTTGKSPTEFPVSSRMFRYDIQALFYMRLYRWCTDYAGPLGFEFVVQEKQPPYDWQTYRFRWDDPMLDSITGPEIDKALAGIQAFTAQSDEPLELMRSYGLSKVPQDIVYPDWWLLAEEERI